MSAQGHVPAPSGDFVLPFDLGQLGVRGRLVRLDKTSARALSAHKLGEGPARVLAESLALCAMLGTALKLDGRLTVQTKSAGALDLIAADYYGANGTIPRGVRGYARVKAERLTALDDISSFATLVGEGSLAITIEPRRGGQTYQGIVSLAREGIAASAQTYFAQSEQLPTILRLAAAPLYKSSSREPHWRAGGIMLQVTAEAARNDDDWERLSLLVKTVEDIELLDTELSAETLLWRLFNEDEVRVQPFESLAFRCDCDGARIASVLKSYHVTERAGLSDPDGVIRARCEFCGNVHEISAAEL